MRPAKAGVFSGDHRRNLPPRRAFLGDECDPRAVPGMRSRPDGARHAGLWAGVSIGRFATPPAAFPPRSASGPHPARPVKILIQPLDDRTSRARRASRGIGLVHLESGHLWTQGTGSRCPSLGAGAQRGSAQQTQKLPASTTPRQTE